MRSETAPSEQFTIRNGGLPLESKTMSAVFDPPVAVPYRRRLLIAFVWIVQLLLAAYYSLLPATKLGEMPGSDKLWHLGGYLVLALPIPLLWSKGRQIFAAAFLLALYGIGLEFAQQYVPGRSFEVADMLANSTGVGCGLALSLWLRGQFLAYRWNAVTGSNPPR